jgi:hypothetical protein
MWLYVQPMGHGISHFGLTLEAGLNSRKWWAHHPLCLLIHALSPIVLTNKPRLLSALLSLPAQSGKHTLRRRFTSRGLRVDAYKRKLRSQVLAHYLQPKTSPERDVEPPW